MHLLHTRILPPLKQVPTIYMSGGEWIPTEISGNLRANRKCIWLKVDRHQKHFLESN